MNEPLAAPPRIGVFDSGFGGLTVLRALLSHLPHASFVYLGDTARLPYGAKSQTTIARYAVESALFLAAQRCDLLVIACNTATALALPEIRAAVTLPVVGVIEPGADAALAATHPGAQILVLATAATVVSHAYRDACGRLGLHATEMPCPLLVPLVEESWIGDAPGRAVTAEVLRLYLTEALAVSTPDAVLLGCTHYPLIAREIAETLRNLGCNAHIIDSAEATALATAALLAPSPAPSISSPTLTFYATDSTEKFARLGSRFLGQPIPNVTLLDLGG